MPIIVRLPFDCTGDDWVLRIVWADGSLRKAVTSSPGAALLALTNVTVAGVIKWQVDCTLTVLETRAMPIGPVAVQYELERRAAGGEQLTYLEGRLIISTGVNDDI